MNENQHTPLTPKKRLIEAFSEIDTLEKMKNEPGFDEATGTELKSGVISEINRIFETNPEIADLMDPIFARAAIIRKQDQQARLEARQKLITVKESPLDYQHGNLYERLSDTSRRAIDQVMLDLIDDHNLEDKGTVVGTAQEAAKKLGLEQEDVDRAYGLLSAIEDNALPEDIIEFVAVSFTEAANTSEDHDSDSSETESNGESGASYGLSDSYIGRVRRSSDREIISIVLDAVPPAPSNAIYILRNDDKSIESVATSFPNKMEARANGARRVYHTETGESGALKRVNKWLCMPFDKFNDQETRVR